MGWFKKLSKKKPESTSDSDSTGAGEGSERNNNLAPETPITNSLESVLTNAPDSPDTIYSEGWLKNDYLILFSEVGIEDANNRYSITQYLPGYVILGLRGWDDFIVRDIAGNMYTVPTVPIDLDYLKKYKLPDKISLKPDNRYKDKIKWYKIPIVFSGDPNVGPNLTWVNHNLHAELVVSWNNLYRSKKAE